MGWPGGVTGVAADFGTSPNGLSTSQDLGLASDGGQNLNPTRVPSMQVLDGAFDWFMSGLKQGLAILGGPIVGGVIAVGAVVEAILKHNPHLAGGPAGGISNSNKKEFRRLREIREQFGVLPGASGPWGRIGGSNNIKVFGSNGLLDYHRGRKNHLRAFLALYRKRLRSTDRIAIRNFIDGKIDANGRVRGNTTATNPNSVKGIAKAFGLDSQSHRGSGLNLRELTIELAFLPSAQALAVVKAMLRAFDLSPGDVIGLRSLEREYTAEARRQAELKDLSSRFTKLELTYDNYLRQWRNEGGARGFSAAKRRDWIDTWDRMSVIRRRIIELNPTRGTLRMIKLPQDPRHNVGC